jgi:hypothetical protein
VRAQVQPGLFSDATLSLFLGVLGKDRLRPQKKLLQQPASEIVVAADVRQAHRPTLEQIG